jgi:hypothetical protein
MAKGNIDKAKRVGFLPAMAATDGVISIDVPIQPG